MRRNHQIALMLTLAILGLMNSPVNAQKVQNVPREAGLRLPLIYWTGNGETAAALKKAGIDQIAVPLAEVANWRKAGFRATGVSEADLKGRQKLAVPKLAGRGNVASATRRPWIDANGWLFTRQPKGRFIYELPAGKAAIAAAEAYAYGVDALLKIAPEDLAEAGKMLAYLRALPVRDLPTIADLTVIDNGSPQLEEVLNLLTRRNLLYTVAKVANPRHSINIVLGSKDYPETEAADPSAFAQAIRKKLGDDNRSLRIYGSEIVICRLVGNDSHARIHLVNYSGREADSLRVRLRGRYSASQLRSYGLEKATLEDMLISDEATEFTVSKVGPYAVIDLQREAGH